MIENHMTQGNAEHDAETPQWAKAEALDDVIDTILTHGEYPRPTLKANHVCQFDLCDWIIEHYDTYEIATIFTRLLTDFSTEAELARIEASDKLEKLLREELADDDMVAERAEEIIAEREE